MTPLRVVIVDDEPPARRKIRRLLERCADTLIAGEADSAESAIALINAARPDLVFLDIQMPDRDGFAVLSAIDRPPDLQVIFVTAFDQHALRAFEVHALDYLLKPVSPQRFEESIERARQRSSLHAERLSQLLSSLHTPRIFAARVALNTGEKTLFVSTTDVLYAESARNYVLVHAGVVHQIRSSLDAFATQLDPVQFARINRSQIVNMHRVRELRPWFHGDYRAILSDGSELSWSRRYSPKSHLSRV